jgi:uncharacterized membrane protein YgcG
VSLVFFFFIVPAPLCPRAPPAFAEPCRRTPRRTAAQFNIKPSGGIKFLVAHGTLADEPHAVAQLRRYDVELWKQEEARRVLTELYTAYAPKKLNDIPTLLEAYAGQEDELIASARLKYAKADQVYKKKRGFGKQGASSSSSGGGGGGGGDSSGGGGAGGTLGSTMAHSLSCSSHGKGMVDGEAGRLKTKAWAR